MKLNFLIIALFLSLCSLAQNEDKILFEKGYSLQYAHYETDLIDIMLSKDSIKSNLAHKIVNQLQKQAISEYDRLIKEFPESELLIDAIYQKAEALYSIGENKDAKENFRQVIAVNPKKGKSLLMLAYIALGEKEYQDALNYIEDRKKINPTYFCGNEIETEKSQIKYVEEQCKIGLAKK